MVKQAKENIWNLPNALTLSRIIISFITIFFIFAGFDIFYIISAFIIGMITDCLDGWVARRFKLTTEFGGKFDMVADRFLMVGVAFASIIKLNASGILSNNQLLQIFLILSREIIAFSGVLITIMAGRGVLAPRPRFIGKATTFMQAITFPMILLSIFYQVFSFSLYFAVATSIIGVVSAFYYINDVKNLVGNKNNLNQVHPVK